MKRGPKADPLYLDNMVDLVLLVREGIAGIDEAAFLADRIRGDAIALRLGSIGEVSGKLSREFKDRHPEIPWVKLTKLRNIVAHHYDQLEYRIRWDVANRHMEALERVCRAELERLDGAAGGGEDGN